MAQILDRLRHKGDSILGRLEDKGGRVHDKYDNKIGGLTSVPDVSSPTHRHVI
jgi:hypothetical protein